MHLFLLIFLATAHSEQFQVEWAEEQMRSYVTGFCRTKDFIAPTAMCKLNIQQHAFITARNAGSNVLVRVFNHLKSSKEPESCWLS